MNPNRSGRPHDQSHPVHDTAGRLRPVIELRLKSHWGYLNQMVIDLFEHITLDDMSHEYPNAWLNFLAPLLNPRLNSHLKTPKSK